MRPEGELVNGTNEVGIRVTARLTSLRVTGRDFRRVGGLVSVIVRSAPRDTLSQVRTREPQP